MEETPQPINLEQQEEFRLSTQEELDDMNKRVEKLIAETHRLIGLEGETKVETRDVPSETIPDQLTPHVEKIEEEFRGNPTRFIDMTTYNTYMAIKRVLLLSLIPLATAIPTAMFLSSLLVGEVFRRTHKQRE